MGKNERLELLEKYKNLRFERYSLGRELIHLNRAWTCAVFYKENPMELKQKYNDVVHYMKIEFPFYFIDSSFYSLSEIFFYLKTKRKQVNYYLSVTKLKKKYIQNQLSRIPRKVQS